jgi:hypothetical protein
MEHENLNTGETANSDLGAVSGSDFLELLDLVDWMASWINNVGKGDYSNGVRSVKDKTKVLRDKYHCH